MLIAFPTYNTALFSSKNRYTPHRVGSEAINDVGSGVSGVGTLIMGNTNLLRRMLGIPFEHDQELMRGCREYPRMYSLSLNSLSGASRGTRRISH